MEWKNYQNTRLVYNLYSSVYGSMCKNAGLDHETLLVVTINECEVPTVLTIIIDISVPDVALLHYIFIF